LPRPVTPNPFYELGGQIYLRLSNGMETVIDAEDYERVAPYRWIPHHQGSSLTYAVGYIRTDGRRRCTYLHRLLLNEPGKETHHIDGNSLNNSRSNLRTVSLTVSRQNRRHQRNGTGYKGVTRHGNRYRASVSHEGIRHQLGMFDSAEDAGRAYDVKARELRADTLVERTLNFPDGFNPL
jgi:hypothetical protein